MESLALLQPRMFHIPRSVGDGNSILGISQLEFDTNLRSDGSNGYPNMFKDKTSDKFSVWFLVSAYLIYFPSIVVSTLPRAAALGVAPQKILHHSSVFLTRQQRCNLLHALGRLALDLDHLLAVLVEHCSRGGGDAKVLLLIR